MNPAPGGLSSASDRPIVENLGKTTRLTGEGRKGMHEASKFEDANIFLHSFLKRRKIEERGFFF